MSAREIVQRAVIVAIGPLAWLVIAITPQAPEHADRYYGLRFMAMVLTIGSVVTLVRFVRILLRARSRSRGHGDGTGGADHQ